MVQVRKPEIQDAILAGAKELFESKGYNQTTVGQIAEQASVTTSNIYNYFPSKLDIFFAIYTPWYAERLEALDREVDAIEGPREKLRKVLSTILRDLPVEDHCFSNNLIQAVSTRPADRAFYGSNLGMSEKKVSAILRRILPECRQWIIDDDVFSHFLLMAFDGFAMHARLTGPERRMEETIEMLCEFILGPAGEPEAVVSHQLSVVSKGAG
ncbi:MAG: TetR/AcrR family transcriptional regulator [Deltaproteobacteria bacterium]|nr:TetR/AcrR family transcriptional regulator [Deltaproteobacteria bacterium]